MAFSYVFTLFMLFGGLFGAGNDLLDYIPAEAYWKLKAVPLKFETMADEVRLADPAAAVNLAKVFENASGADRDRLALALIDQGEAARTVLDRLARSPDPDLARRATACLIAIDKEPKERSVRRLMAIRTLGALGRKEAIPLLEPLLGSTEPFVAAYAAEAIASLDGKPPLMRPFPLEMKNDIWRLPADCRAVAQIAPRVAGPELADRVLAAMNIPAGVDRADAIDGLTFTLVQIADRFGDMRFDGITLGGSADLGEKTGYVLAILRGQYDHATVNRVFAAGRTPYNDFPGGRIYVPGGMAIYAPSDDLLIFATAPSGTPPVQAVITAAGNAPTTRPATQPATDAIASAPSTQPAQGDPNAPPRLGTGPAMVKLIALIDTTQPLWLALKSSEASRAAPGLAALETLTVTGSPSRTTPLELHLQAKFTDADAARNAEAALTALLPSKPAASPQDGGRPASSPNFLGTITAALSAREVRVDGDRLNATATLTLARADVLRLLLTSMDRPHKDGN